MEHTLAMQIVGIVLLLIGIMKNRDPIGFNKSIFGDVEGVEGGPAASMRMLIGGGFAGIGLINLYCSYVFSDSLYIQLDSTMPSEAVLVGTAIGLTVVFATIIGAKLRGFLDHIPTPPMIIFPSLIAICLYSVLI